jgi:type I restriction enzyme S subunit
MELSKYCKYTTSRIDPASLNVDNYISTENMMQNKGGVTAASKVPTEKAVEYKPGDILISNIRPYFKKIWLADRSGGCSSDVLCIRALKGTDSIYLYYLLSQDSFFDYVMSGAKGSKMPRGDKSQIMKWDVDLPGIDEQRRIGQMLKNIDDKIAINNRINHNLEEQAQALYKSWFVNFEPFKGGKFIDSELGMIPEGWRVGRIADMVADTYNGDWGKDELTGPYTKRVLCIRGADIPSLRVGSSGKMPIRFIQDKHFQSKFLKDGDIVVEISGGSPTQSTGRYCRISDSLINRYGNSLICTNFCKAVRPLGGYSFFLSLLWDHLYDNGVMFSYENGTTGIKNLDLAGLLAGEPVLIPCFDIVQSFSKMISSLNHKVLFNGLENELLAAQRDTLLPKLMSGTTKLTN